MAGPADLHPLKETDELLRQKSPIKYAPKVSVLVVAPTTSLLILGDAWCLGMPTSLWALQTNTIPQPSPEGALPDTARQR